MALQTVLQALFPPQCVLCETRVQEEAGFCPACWREAEFLTGALCDRCAVPLPGAADGTALSCDRCLAEPPPWGHARVPLRYAGKGRALVLAFKHSDRTDIARGAARMMAQVLEDIVTPDTHLVPVPLHWRRMLARRYNQSALLAKALAQRTGARFDPDALRRVRATRMLKGLTKEARAAELQDAIRPTRAGGLAGCHVVLVDDVMTSGATLAACTQAAFCAGAARVDVAALARVASDA